MIKSVVLWNLPEGMTSEEFERRYFEEHVPLVKCRPGVYKYVTTKFRPNPDGSQPKYYRMAEIYYLDADALQKASSSNAAKTARQQIVDWKWRDVVFMTLSEESVEPLDAIREGE